MDTKNERESGIELLKIICIFLIIIHHYSVHGGYTFDVETFNNKVFLIQVLSLYGKSACCVFALATGYFMIVSTTTFKSLLKKIIIINIEMFFYSIIILFIFMNNNLVNLTRLDIIHSIFPTIWGNWYVVSYTILLLITPFLNKLLKELSKSQFQGLIVITLIIWSVIPTITNFAWKFSDVDFFIIMYIIGSYIKLYKFDKKKYKNIWNLLLAIIAAILLVLTVYYFDQKGIRLNDNKFIKNATKMKNVNSIFSVLFALSIFLFFLRFKFKSKIINQIAKSSLGIYLLHDNDLVRPYLWKKIYPNVEFLANPFDILLIHIVLKVFAVFLICLIIDQIRLITLHKIFLKLLNKKDNRELKTE